MSLRSFARISAIHRRSCDQRLDRMQEYSLIPTIVVAHVDTRPPFPTESPMLHDGSLADIAHSQQTSAQPMGAQAHPRRPDVWQRMLPNPSCLQTHRQPFKNSRQPRSQQMAAWDQQTKQLPRHARTSKRSSVTIKLFDISELTRFMLTHRAWCLSVTYSLTPRMRT